MGILENIINGPTQKVEYYNPVDGKAEIKKDNGDTIVVDIKKALDVYNKMELVRVELMGGKKKEYTDSSLVDLVSYKNEHVIVYTSEHADGEYIRNMLLIPEKLYTGEATVFDVFRDSLSNMMEKLKSLEFEEYAAEIID